MISDFADLRAPTPSAAMEMLLPDQSEMLYTIDTMMERYHNVFGRLIRSKEESLGHLKTDVCQTLSDEKFPFGAMR